MRSIEFCGTDVYYDMYVPGPENYVAEGFVNHNTGVGKGRQVAGIILDNFNQGRTKALWLSEKKPLLKDAQRDWSGVGGDPKKIFDLSKTKAGVPLGASDGIAFTTYDTLKSSERMGKDEAGKTIKGRSRVDQIVEWLGDDFEGVIALDESHNLSNAIQVKGERGFKDAAQKALAGIELQERLPNARVIYVSATGATEVANLAYADRLGLWGRGTAFPNKNAFIQEIHNGGIAAMELVARDMKAMGSYTARSLSYDGVEYSRLEHPLTPEQRQNYDALAEAWQVTLNNFNEALKAAAPKDGMGNPKIDGKARAAALSAFWGAHQRFFNQIITAMQMPSVIRSIEGDLKEGRQVVLQLVNTNEASQKRGLAKIENEADLEDLDMSPADQLMQLVEHSFPVAQHESYIDDMGNTRSRPVVDSKGNIVENKAAVAMREALLDKLGAVRKEVSDGPLELLINHFGPDKVAEVTGRKQRVVRKEDAKGDMRTQLETRSSSANLTEADAFQNAKKPILVFSDAGGTGRSYHADNTSPSKDNRRSHYLVQAGWRADKAIQGFGRTHRTNQASAPIFHLVTTDLQGQKRFISSIARRLAQLGALTKGERRTGDQGIFSAKDNLESREASDALSSFFRDLNARRVPEITQAEFEKQTGLRLTDDQGNRKKETPPIQQFLNRLLSLKVDTQNAVFGAFESRLNDAVDRAAAAGTLDVGTETLMGDRITKDQERTVHTDSQSGAETKYVRLKVEDRNNPATFDEVAEGKRLTVGRKPLFFAVNENTGRIYGVTGANTVTEAKTGRVLEQYRISEPLTYRYVERDRLDHPEWFGKTSTPWRKITDQAEARRLWDEQVSRIPEYSSRDVHLITGAILPIWDRVAGVPKVYRAQTAEGERLLGRVVEEKDIGQTLKALGAEGAMRQLTPEEIAGRILEGERATLANGWALKRSLVAGEQRIELTGPGWNDRSQIAQDGVFAERIGYDTRYFVPTGDDSAKVIQRITEHRPITEFSGSDESRGVAQRGEVPAEHQDGMEDFQEFAGDRPDAHQAARDYVMARGTETGHEHIAVVDQRTGRVAYALTSDHPDGGAFSPDLQRHLETSGADLILHHNHPADRGLSDIDTLVSTAPGTAWIIAHGPSGDFFAGRLSEAMRQALPGSPAERMEVMRAIYGGTQGRVVSQLRQLHDNGVLTSEEASLLREDLVSRAMAQAGVIDYQTSRSLAPMLDSIAKNLIRASATRARELARVHTDDRFQGASDGELSRLDRATERVQFEPAMEKISRGHADAVAAGRTAGEGTDQPSRGGTDGAPVGREPGAAALGQSRDEVLGAGRPAADALSSGRMAEGASQPAEPDIPAGQPRDPIGDRVRGEGAGSAGGGEEGAPGRDAGRLSADDARIAERIRGGGGDGGGGGEPPAASGAGSGKSPLKTDLDKIMHTDERSWFDGKWDPVRKFLSDRPGTRLRAYWFDREAALTQVEKNLFGPGLAPGRISPTNAAKFSKNWRSIFRTAVTKGQIRLRDDGVVELIPDAKPLEGIWQQLANDQKSSGRDTTDAYAMWDIVTRAKRLMAEGRENLIPSEMIEKWENVDRKYLRPDGSNLFQDVHAEMQGWHNNLLDFGQKAGIINAESRALWQFDDYVPFYRAFEEDRIAAPSTGPGGIVNVRSPIKHLEGGTAKINNVYENTVLNAAAMIRRSLANVAGQKTRDMLVLNTDILTPMSKEARVPYGDPAVQEGLRAAGLDPQTLTEAAKEGARDLFGALKRHEPDVISVMDNGKANYYRVNDPLMLDAVTAAGPQTMNGVAALLAAPARLLRAAVVFDPAFALAHNLRMAQHAYMLTGANPIMSIWHAIEQSKGLTPDALKLIAAGTMSGKYDIGIEKRIRAEITSPEYQNSLINTPLKAARWMKEFGEKVMEASDIGPRIAVYRRVLKQTGSEADAMNAARDLLDFSNHGNGGAAMFLAQTIPFLNARWQGMDRSYRGFRSEDRNAILMRGSLITAATLALWYQNKDDPEYQRKEDWDKQYAYQIKVGPGQWFRLPIAFEGGALFSSLPMIIADYLYNGSMRQAHNATFSLFESVFKFNPIPVAIRPGIEIAFNHNTFTGQPIINEREAAMLPDLQYGPTDSAAVVAATQAFNSASPYQVAPATVQHLIRGYLAGWGTYITAAADYLGEQSGALPAHSGASQPHVIGRFLHQEPEAGNRLMRDYYELRRSIDAVGNSVKDAQKNQDAALVKQLLADHPGYSDALRHRMDSVGTKLSKIRDVYQHAEKNPALSAEKKTAARDAYYRQRDQMLDQLKPFLRQAEGLTPTP